MTPLQNLFAFNKFLDNEPTDRARDHDKASPNLQRLIFRRSFLTPAIQKGMREAPAYKDLSLSPLSPHEGGRINYLY